MRQFHNAPYCVLSLETTWKVPSKKYIRLLHLGASVKFWPKIMFLVQLLKDQLLQVHMLLEHELSGVIF